MGRFNLKKLNVVEVKEQYQVKIWNRLPALQNSDDYDDDDDNDDDDDDVDINRAPESIRIWKFLHGQCEVKEHKSLYDAEFSNVLDQREQAKLQCLQNPSQINEDNPNIVRCELGRT